MGGTDHATPDGSEQGAVASGAEFIASILDKTDVGGLQGIVARLEAAGLGQQVRSWLGSGSNLPITTEQLRAALADEQIEQVAREFGLPVDATLKILADQVPNAVDQANRHGCLLRH